MIDKLFEWNIDGIQANTVFEGADVRIPLMMEDYRDIFTSKEVLDELAALEVYLYEIFQTCDKNYTKDIVDEFHLSYMTYGDKHYIGFDYETIFNNIFKKLNITKRIKLTDLKSEDKKIELIGQLTRGLTDYLFTTRYLGLGTRVPEKESVVDTLFGHTAGLINTLDHYEKTVNQYIDKQVREEKELREKHKSLNKVTEKHVSWKNLMYYTAVKALNIFKYTDDLRYYRYAKNYHKNVSTNKKAEMPKSMFIDKEFYKHDYDLFNRRFTAIQNEKFKEITIRLGIEDKPTVTLDRTLKNGKGLSGKLNTGSKSKVQIDYDKVSETLDRKLKFYQGLSGKVQGIIIDGFKTDTDYIGYVLPNNYVIFDKFYDISKDGTKVMPSYGSGIYVVALDVYEACNRDRAKIRKYIAKNHDYKAFKWNHNDTDSYQKRIEEVLDYHDISTVKFKELKLTNESK